MKLRGRFFPVGSAFFEWALRRASQGALQIVEQSYCLGGRQFKTGSKRPFLSPYAAGAEMLSLNGDLAPRK
jgi:hypothetical protein